jgi:hypothetical protein
MDNQAYNPDQASVDVQKVLEGLPLDDDDGEVQYVPRTRDTPSHQRYESDFEDEPEPYHPDESQVGSGPEEEDYPPSQLSPTDGYGEPYGEDNDAESDVLASIRKKRANMNSYFDMHPDRGAPSGGPDDQNIDDATPKNSYESNGVPPARRLDEDEEEEGEERVVPVQETTTSNGGMDGSKSKMAAPYRDVPGEGAQRTASAATKTCSRPVY